MAAGTTNDAAGMGALPVRQVPALRPLAWLRLGWRDFARVPWTGMLHGAIVAAAGVAIVALGSRNPFLLAGALSGFVLVGPILATGLYELSRLLARGERPGFGDAAAAWRRGTRPLVWLGLLLGAAGTGWVLVSTALFALFVRAPIGGPEDFLRYAAQGQGDLLFLLWLVLGALGAAVVFAATAVSPPLLLGRRVDVRSAILTSVRAVGENPVAMALWAVVIMAATALSMATAMAGFVVAIPVIGHATWHAYRDLVDASSVPLRNWVAAPVATMFGLTEERFAEFGLTFGLAGFMLFMLFIIGNLAKESKAGRLGTFVLFFVLAFGMLGFLAKTVLVWILE